MPVLTGVTPTPDQVKRAYREAFEPAIQQAGGKDGRISRASAERMAERDDAGQLLSDNVLNFLDATGQKTVGSDKFARVVAEYAERHAQREAGPNQRLSLLEIRSLPDDLQADLFHLRGKDDLAPVAPDAPRVAFNENDLYLFMPDFEPTEVIDAGTLTPSGGQVTISGLSDFPAELQPVVEDALQLAWDRVLKHRSWNDRPVEIGPTQNGTLRVGPVVDDETGKAGLLVNWHDIDDGSFAWFYAKDDQGTYQREADVFLN